jgi:hypothetical protein
MPRPKLYQITPRAGQRSRGWPVLNLVRPDDDKRPSRSLAEWAALARTKEGGPAGCGKCGGMLTKTTAGVRRCSHCGAERPVPRG